MTVNLPIPDPEPGGHPDAAGRRKITFTQTRRPPKAQRGRPKGALQLWAWRLIKPRCGYCGRFEGAAGRALHEECDGTLSLPAKLRLFNRDLSAWPACTVTEILLSRLGRLREVPCWCSCRGDREMSWAELRGWAKAPGVDPETVFPSWKTPDSLAVWSPDGAPTICRVGENQWWEHRRPGAPRTPPAGEFMVNLVEYFKDQPGWAMVAGEWVDSGAPGEPGPVDRLLVPVDTLPPEMRARWRPRTRQWEPAEGWQSVGDRGWFRASPSGRVAEESVPADSGGT